MKHTICEMYLNPNNSYPGVYHSGQQLSGNVVLTFYEKQKIKNIVIQILGIGKCEWNEQRRLFQAEEIYYKSEIKISESSRDFMAVPPGIYTYPFETDLPDNLPTSCEGKYGFIRYLASVNIIRPNQPVQTHTIAFTVIKPHNLNASPLYQSPMKKQQCLKFFRLQSLSRDIVSITASIPTSGFAPGQIIPLEIDVNNTSDRNIFGFKVELIKVLIYTDVIRKQSKKHKTVLISTFVNGCSANTCALHMAGVVVPPVPATDCSNKMLRISYELKIYGDFSKNITMKPLIKLPITIGTVPLYSTYRCVHFEDSAEYHHIEPFKYEALLDDYLNLGNKTGDKNSQYAPVYPMFTARSSKRRSNAETMRRESVVNLGSEEFSSSELTSDESISVESINLLLETDVDLTID